MLFFVDISRAWKNYDSTLCRSSTISFASSPMQFQKDLEGYLVKICENFRLPGVTIGFADHWDDKFFLLFGTDFYS